jgi:TonB family protein
LECRGCGAQVESQVSRCPSCGQELKRPEDPFAWLAGAPAKPTSWPAIGRGKALTSRYEIRAVLGDGPLATVFRAFDGEVEAEVAVKVLRPNLLETAEARTRFLEGCTLAKRLSHPNLVRVFFADVAGLFPFFAMQLVEGLTLRQILEARRARNKPFSLAETVPIVGQIAVALEAIYDHFPGHGLLKPENVLVLPDVLKVTDAHLAFSVPLSVLLEIEGSKGGLSYAAPEVVAHGQLSRAADVFSLATMATELLATSSTPLSGRAELAEGLDPLLRKALAVDPSARIHTPLAFAQALQGLQGGTSVLRAASMQSATRYRMGSRVASQVSAPPGSAQPPLVEQRSSQASTQPSSAEPPPVNPVPLEDLLGDKEAQPTRTLTPPAESRVLVPPGKSPRVPAAFAAAPSRVEPPDEPSSEDTVVTHPPAPLLAQAASGKRKPAWLRWSLAGVLVLGAMTAVVWFLVSARESERQTLLTQAAEDRRILAQEIAALRKLRAELEAREARAEKEATAAQRRAAEALQAAGDNPARKKEAQRLAQEARKLEAARQALRRKRKEIEEQELARKAEKPAAPQVALAAPTPAGASPQPLSAPTAPAETAASPPATPPETRAPKPAVPAPPLLSEAEKPPAAPAGLAERAEPPAPSSVTKTEAREPPAPAPDRPAAAPAPPEPSAAPSPPRTIYLREDMPRPQRIGGPDPVYTEAAKAANITGKVELLFTVTPEGKVRNIRILRDLPILGEVCRSAVRRWTFKPVVVEGQPVSVIMRQAFVFTLDR